MPEPADYLEPAASLIEKLGGPQAIAKATGFTEAWIYRWRYPLERGGTDGRIPSKAQRAIWQACQQGRLPKIQPADLLECTK